MSTPPARHYHHTVPGPDLERPFFVTSGLIAVIGHTSTITLPTGATWPGLDALDDALLDDLQPSEALATPGATTRPASPDDVSAGLALVQAQRLRTGPLCAQLDRLELHEPGGLSHVTVAALLGVGRESTTKVINQRRRARRSPLPTFSEVTP